jgi:hypothetical protein
MPEYRYYCLNDEGKITRGKHVEVPNLAAAIRAAYDDCGSASMGTHRRVEVWQAARCLYSTGGIAGR